MWILRTVTEGLSEKIYRIMPGGVRTIGRAVGADFILDAALVSRVHCRLTALPDGSLEIKDLESTNGTFVNGQRIDAADKDSVAGVQAGGLYPCTVHERAVGALEVLDLEAAVFQRREPAVHA